MLLKTKLSFGLGFLFFIILALVGFCSYYVGTLAIEADNILKDNYNSLVYARYMLSSLDEMRAAVGDVALKPREARSGDSLSWQLFESGRKTFEANLQKESNNITEINEKEYVEKLNREYQSYLKLSSRMREASARDLYYRAFLPSCERLTQSINAIYDVNMEAVVRKTQMTKKDSARFKNSMSIIGALCILLGLAYFWYFPVYVSTTCGYLANRMRNLLKNLGMATEEYGNDEGLVLLRGLDALENRLGARREDE